MLKVLGQHGHLGRKGKLEMIPVTVILRPSVDEHNMLNV